MPISVQISAEQQSVFASGQLGKVFANSKTTLEAIGVHCYTDHKILPMCAKQNTNIYEHGRA